MVESVTSTSQRHKSFRSGISSLQDHPVRTLTCYDPLHDPPDRPVSPSRYQIDLFVGCPGRIGRRGKRSRPIFLQELRRYRPLLD